MFRIENYIQSLIQKLKITFGERLLYVGLQGSYLRGEATAESDIDIMVVIDKLIVSDLNIYRDILVSVGDFDKSCGFICGKDDLKNWNPIEICHLLHTTKDCFGVLKDIVPEYSAEDEKNFIKLSLNNLFHELCHRYIHSDKEDNISKFPMTCKSVFFILQNMHYLKSGYFAATKIELLSRLQGRDKEILEMSMFLQNNMDYNFDEAFGLLFDWCQNVIINI